MPSDTLSAEERRFLSRYAVRRFWNSWSRYPKATPANLAMVDNLEARGIIERKVRPSGFLYLELTPEGRRAMAKR